ncbi:DUF803-domain-containing protein [Panus rudis PR-1116 ss-1]|nr:DUF803-domain-containing protein [Panus rudis PR-1116 ss-1]
MLTHVDFSYQDGTIALPNLSRATVTGISVAIAGNVLISLALNCQKLAHRRLELERKTKKAQRDNTSHSIPTTDIQRQRSQSARLESATLETEPLLGSSSVSTLYGTHETPAKPPKRTPFGRFWRRGALDAARRADHARVEANHATIPVDVAAVHHAPPSNGKGGEETTGEEDNGRETDYLKSKLWWFGFVLMNIGEVGNFISYGFAPASVVAPLGTFALIANCLFAPLMLGERLRKLDLFGIIIAIIGAVTVVLSANTSDTVLDPPGLIHAIARRTFIAYATIYIVAAIILSGLSERPIGSRFVYIDVGLCALFGGFTVLSTKAISTLLTLEWFDIFTEWITYPVLVVLVGTGIGQIRYLNRALMRFDSKVVVPTQFVLFNLSAIVGSAILYGDFQKATFHQITTFLYGCGATFVGVFMITWTPAFKEELEEAGERDDNEEEDAATLSTLEAVPSRNLRMDSLGRRSRATLIVPEGITSHVGSPNLRHHQSLVALYGFSSAQRVLIVHTPPRDEFIRPLFDVEQEGGSPTSTPHTFRRRRAISWFGEEAPTHAAHSASRAARAARSNMNSREASREGARGLGPSL